jgi:hypothetical protein
MVLAEQGLQKCQRAHFQVPGGALQRGAILGRGCRARTCCSSSAKSSSGLMVSEWESWSQSASCQPTSSISPSDNTPCCAGQARTACITRQQHSFCPQPALRQHKAVGRTFMASRTSRSSRLFNMVRAPPCRVPCTGAQTLRHPKRARFRRSV